MANTVVTLKLSPTELRVICSALETYVDTLTRKANGLDVYNLIPPSTTRHQSRIESERAKALREAIAPVNLTTPEFD